MQTEFKTSEVASHFGVSPNTVRHWGRLYAAHLSPTANLPDGKGDRLFTSRDMAVFQLVATLRKEGASHMQINQRPEETTITPAEIVLEGETVDDLPTTATQQAPAPPPADTSALMLQMTANALERIVERATERESASVRRLSGEVASLRVLVWLLIAVVLLVVISMVMLWAMG